MRLIFFFFFNATTIRLPGFFIIIFFLYYYRVCYTWADRKLRESRMNSPDAAATVENVIKCSNDERCLSRGIYYSFIMFKGKRTKTQFIIIFV